MTTVDYGDFLSRKHARRDSTGFDPDTLCPALFPWQELVTRWSIRRGRAALFESTGLGKSIQQLAWAEAVVRHTKRPVLILAPLAVAAQTVREATKFGIGVPVVQASSQADVPDAGIAVTNYHKLDHFDTPAFDGVVLDESSILKSFMGKTKQRLCEAFSVTPFRLACTATPSPNDYMEIGNHSQFLGVMDSDEMLSRWFINAGDEVGAYRLKKHAEDDFWQWVASWAVAVTKPSDIGFPDVNYNLPPLKWIEHVVSGKASTGDGKLFDDSQMTATTLQRIRRDSVAARVAAVKKAVMAEPDEPWLIWCNTNDESTQLAKAIKGAVEVVGSEDEDAKADKLVGFSEGRITRLVTKARIAGFGMNWQHCRRVAFVGLTFSFEDIYQAIRRCWRFGQTLPVHVHAVTTDSDGAIIATITRKQVQHDAMQHKLRTYFARQILQTTPADRRLTTTTAARVTLPAWIRTKESSV